MTPTLHDSVRNAPAAARVPDLLVPSLVGGAGIYVASLLLELFEPGTVVFLSWVLGLPLVLGAVLGARGRRPALAFSACAAAYLVILVHDWIATGGDQVFHLVLAALTGGLAALAAMTAQGVRRYLARRAA